MKLVNIASQKTTEINKIIFAFFVSFVLSVTIYVAVKIFISQPTTNNYSYHDNNFDVLSLKIPANLNFCGEKIPSNDFRIRTALEKEFFANSYWKSNSVILFHRVQKWFPYIEPILKQEGVPDDFKYMAVIESHLTNAASPAGACGFWQLVSVSARNYGLIVNNEVDERYSVEKSTRAACKHIKQAYAVFKNWTLAAAAYNLGINGVIYELRRQKTDNYFNLLLNLETGSFVYRILAYKTLFSNPAHFGIKKKKLTYYSKIPYNFHKTDSSFINIKAFSKNIGVSERIIKAHNPWILTDTIHNPERHIFEIRAPKKLNENYSSYLSDLNINRSNDAIYTPFELEASVSTPSLSETVELKHDSVLAATKKTVFYVVREENESLNNIATKYGVSVDDLKKWNNLGNNDKIEKGKVLNIHYFEPK